LRQNGYRVDYWPSVDGASLRRLENGEYDIVILDIVGIVAPGFTDTGNGLGVLRRIKRANPSQVVIACSGRDYSLDDMEFFRSTDAMLGKPISAVRCMEVIDDALRTKIGAARYWDGVAALLRDNGVAEVQIRKLESELAHSIRKGREFPVARVEEIIGDVAAIVTIGELVRKAAVLALGIQS
jgi:DNA-binding response OmpR family regulator